MDLRGNVPRPGAVLDVLAGGGELGERMRAHDWAKTPLGPVERWPQALKTAVRIMLTSRQPMFVWWGDELINLYNDAYKAIVGGKHPEALGQPASWVWREIWDQIAPRVQAALGGIEGTYDEALLLIMERYGYPEETYYTFSYSPVPNDEGGVGGIFCANTDDTQRIIGQRQLSLLRELAAATADARTVEEACAFAARCLESNPRDLPFALIYSVDPDQQRAALAGTTRIPRDHPAAPTTIDLDGPAAWPLADVLRANAPVRLADIDARFSTLPAGAWDCAPSQAIAMPITSPGRAGTAGILIAGLNPYRLHDDTYEGFLRLVSGQIGTSIASAQAYEDERQRAEALAELDRAKTIFFSNVSHEFRTPLTLLLGPIEDGLDDVEQPLPPAQRERQEVARRNALRLLRLVNTLLDFSRIEAGRIQAAYEAVDLPALTADLAATFRSAVERAGLRLTVDCPPLPPGAETYVDREMWEKIVLNLLSNAFKFTFDGEIVVSLQARGDHAELVVRDTGTGIAEEELPRLFERFHRVQGARARTHEGTGIGLALVRELVHLHGGEITVESTADLGTAFTVSVPLGSAHLPADRLGAARTLESTATGAAPFVDEALHWLPDPTVQADSLAAPGLTESEAVPAMLAPAMGDASSGQTTRRPRVLLADDNRDMREYVTRLLQQRYAVEAVGDGEAALAAARTTPPDLILSDVMMPRLDGFGLISALRADPHTREIPILLLSARAGEEARIEGLQGGADDYLTKPFSARELLVRVDTQIQLAAMRTESTRRERTARQAAEEAARARDEFLSIASHELRNPVAGIKGAAQLLLRSHQAGRLDVERLIRYLTSIEAGSNRLAALTEDLLDVSRLQQGLLPLRARLTDLGALTREAIRRLPRPQRHRINAKLPADVEPISIDPDRVEQIVTNLLENAIKYSPDGKVIDVALERDETGMMLRVRDHGIGLPPGTAERIFQPFGRAPNAVTANIPGLGLGLYISRQIAQQHGGRLWAESPGEGQGTTLCLKLPVSRPGQPEIEHGVEHG